MASIEELQSAYKNAYEAGNRQDAEILLKAIEAQSRTPEQMYGKLGPSGASWGGAQNFADSYLGGLGDEVKGATSALKHKLTGGGLPFSEAYEQAKAANQSARSQYAQANPGTALTTGLGGAVTSGAVTGMALPSTTLPQRIGSNAALGAGYGAAGAEGGATDRLKGAAAGGAIGGLTPVAMEGAARVVRPNTDPNVVALMERGITPTPGQILGGIAKSTEEKSTSIPLIGAAINMGRRRAVNQFNTATYREILDPLGLPAPQLPGRNAVTEVGDRISNEFEQILPRINITIDQQFGADFNRIQQTVLRDLPQGSTQAAAFTRTVQEQVAHIFRNNGVARGQDYNEVRRHLMERATRLNKSTNPADLDLADAFHDLAESLDDAMVRSNQGVNVTINGNTYDAGQRLADAREAWAKLVRLEGAAGSQGAQEGVFSPAQLSAAVKHGDNSTRKRAFARGDALLQELSDPGKAVLSSTVPDSGTAGRLSLQAIAAGLAGGGLHGMGVPPEVLLAALGAAGSAGATYSPWGQRALAAILTQRPGMATPAADLLRDLSPATTTGLLNQYRD